MSSSISEIISRHRQKILWGLLLVAVILSGIMLDRLGSMDYELAKVRGDGIVSLELAWRKGIAREILLGWDRGGLLPTARKSVYWDFLFILSYTAILLLGVALAWGPLSRLPVRPRKAMRLIVIAPIGAAVCDCIENLLMLMMLSDIGDVGTILSRLTALCASLKFILIGAFVAIALYLARPALRTIVRVRFSILMLVFCVALLFVPQWQEILRSIMETNGDVGMNSRAVWLAFASLTAAFSTWYSARVLFMFCVEPKGDDCSRDPMDSLKRWLPRVTGAMVIVVVTLGFLVSAPFGHYAAAIEPAAYQGIAFVVFCIVVALRRMLFGFPPDSPMINIAEGFTGLNERTKYPLAALAVGNVLCFLFFLLFPEYAVHVGAAAVAVFAIALLVPWGSLLVHYGTKLHYPVLSVLVVLVVVFSLTNDNHSIRLCNEMVSIDRECPVSDPTAEGKRDNSEAAESRTTFTAFMDEWINERKSGDRFIPVFIVSAEGGGIRAAFWTAHVLATLQDRAGAEGLDFSRHVLAISGVSGGSLGGAVFAASVKYMGEICRGKPGCYSYGRLAHRVLGEDFLSPTVATMLFPDLLQRFIPVPRFDDRAMTLEKSWERAWNQSTRKDFFTAPFAELWSSNKAQVRPLPPLLLLNSTVVETGQRLIMSPVRLTTNDLEFAEVFRDAIDGYTLLGDDVPLSTAVHLSARFTYVSPAGKVFRDGNDTREPGWFRLVDGGYFENSGAVTATELLDAVMKYKERHKDIPIEPFVIHISNEPVIPDDERARKQLSFNPIMGEILSPLRALLHVRPARGFQAREFLQRWREGDAPRAVRHVHFLPCKCELDLPLGWMLSDAVQQDLINQFPSTGAGEDAPVDKGEDPLSPDRDNLERVLGHMLGWALSDEMLVNLANKFIPSGNGEAAKRYNLDNMQMVLTHLHGRYATGESSADREADLVQSCRQGNPLPVNRPD